MSRETRKPARPKCFLRQMREFIQSALIESKVEATILKQKEAEELRAFIEDRYASSRGDSPLWERLKDSASVHREDGWLKACEFVREGESVLFFDKGECAAMWRFSSGDDVLKVLRECPALEIYITRPDASFVLCHNHHDYLIGVGASKPWLQELSNE